MNPLKCAASGENTCGKSSSTYSGLLQRHTAGECIVAGGTFCKIRLAQLTAGSEHSETCGTCVRIQHDRPQPTAGKSAVGKSGGFRGKHNVLQRRTHKAAGRHGSRRILYVPVQRFAVVGNYGCRRQIEAAQRWQAVGNEKEVRSVYFATYYKAVHTTLSAQLGAKTAGTARYLHGTGNSKPCQCDR